MRHRLTVLSAFAVVAMLCACGGSGGMGGRGPLPIMAQVPAPSSSALARAVPLSLVVPLAPSSASVSHRRKPAFVSPSTLAASISVSQVTGVPAITMVVDLSSSSTTCTTQANQRFCTISLPVPFGNDTFSITTYDQAPSNGSIPANAHVLGRGSVTQTISASFTGAVTLAIDAVVGGFGTLPSFSSLPADGVQHFYGFVVNPADFDNNPIHNGVNDPYSNPITVSLVETGGNGHAQLVLNASVVGTSAVLHSAQDTIAVQYDGGGLPGYFVTTSFSTTGVAPTPVTLAPLYVTSTSGLFANHSLALAGIATTVPLSAQEASGNGVPAFTTSASNGCANAATVTAPVVNNGLASFSVAGGTQASPSGCVISVSDGTSTVAIKTVNAPPVVPSPSSSPTVSGIAAH